MAEIKTPNGLTTEEIPISTKVQELSSINTEIWNSLDDTQDYLKKTNKIQTHLLTKIYGKLNNEVKTSFDGKEASQKETDEFQKESLDQLLKINRSVEVIMGNILTNVVETTTPLPPPITDEIPTTTPKPKNDNEESPVQSKFFAKLSKQFDDLATKVGSVSSKMLDSFMPTLLGPLNLVTQPLKQLTGLDPIDSFKKGVGNIFGKKSSKNPSKEDVAKGGFIGAGFLYLSNLLGNKGKDGDGEGGGLKGLLSGSGIGSLLVKGLGIGAIVGSIFMMILDGIKGIKLSDIWGTTKISGVIGAVIGGTDKGLKGVFKNAGKWGLMGAGIGSLIAPGIGTLIGGLIGGAFGAITNWIGAENIAKISDKIGKMLGGVSSIVTDKIKEAFNTLKNFNFSSEIDASGGLLNFIIDYTPKVLGFIFGGIKDVFASINESELVTDLKAKFPIIEKIGSIAETFFSPFINAWKTIFSELDFGDIWKSDSSIASKLGMTVRDVLFAWMDGLGSFFSNIGENIVDIGSSFLDGGKDTIFEGIKGLFSAGKEGVTDFAKGLTESSVDDAIITKDGQIIHTNQDDNIIATKNDPRQIVKMPEVNNNNSVNIETGTLVELLRELVSVTKSKPTGNSTFIDNTSKNFDSLRMLGVQ